MQPCLRTTDVACSSLQFSVSLAGPVVNIVDEENEQSTSFVSTLTSCSEHHHVHICSTTISTGVSLNITEPTYSTNINNSDMYVCRSISTRRSHMGVLADLMHYFIISLSYDASMM